MNRINKDIEKYLEEIKKNLVCSASQKKTVINDLRNSIYDYVDTSKATDIEDIYSHFGQPEDIAEQFVSETSGKYLKKSLSVKKVLIAAIVALFTIALIFLTIDFIDSLNSNDAYSVEEPIVEYDGEIPGNHLKDGQSEEYRYNKDGTIKEYIIQNPDGSIKERIVYSKDGSVKEHKTY